ncbi:MAG: phosphoribosylanthranilate isomerase [Pyrinomonadaceae bacterium]
MVKIKVCGITNYADAKAAVEAGADSLGFSFYEKSPRYIDPEDARAIIRQLKSASTIAVGVFVNVSDPAKLLQVAQRAGVAWIQLHGEESPVYCRQLSPYPVIKALRVGSDFSTDTVKPFSAHAILLDAFSTASRGGSGERFDWRIARNIREHTAAMLYLAGGLTPANVLSAVEFVRPYAVDVCSGVESEPGIKDHTLLRRFIKEARRSTSA